MRSRVRFVHGRRRVPLSTVILAKLPPSRTRTSEADRGRKGGAGERTKLSPQGGSGVERTLRRRNPPNGSSMVTTRILKILHVILALRAGIPPLVPPWYRPCLSIFPSFRGSQRRPKNPPNGSSALTTCTLIIPHVILALRAGIPRLVCTGSDTGAENLLSFRACASRRRIPRMVPPR